MCSCRSSELELGVDVRGAKESLLVRLDDKYLRGDAVKQWKFPTGQPRVRMGAQLVARPHLSLPEQTVPDPHLRQRLNVARIGVSRDEVPATFGARNLEPRCPNELLSFLRSEYLEQQITCSLVRREGWCCPHPPTICGATYISFAVGSKSRTTAPFSPFSMV